MSVGPNELITLRIIRAPVGFRAWRENWTKFYSDIMIGAMASQITSLTIVYSTACSGADQRKHQSSASLAFVQGILKWPVTRKMFPFDDVIMFFVCSLENIFPNFSLLLMCLFACLCIEYKKISCRIQNNEFIPSNVVFISHWNISKRFILSNWIFQSNIHTG